MLLLNTIQEKLHKGLPMNEMRRNDDSTKDKCLYQKKNESFAAKRFPPTYNSC